MVEKDAPYRSHSSLINPWLIPALLFFCSLLPRLILMSKGPYHLDCLTMASHVKHTLVTGQFHYLHSHGFPGMAVLATLTHAFAKLFGIHDPVWAVNMLNVWLSSLGPVLLYRIGTLLFNRTMGIMAAALLMFNPLYLALSVFGNSHIPFIIALFLALIQIIKFEQNEHIQNLIWGTLFLGIAGSIRIQDLLPVLPAIICLILYPPKKWPYANSSFKEKIKIAFIMLGLTLLLTGVSYIHKILISFSGSNTISQFWHKELFSLFQGFMAFFPFSKKILIDIFIIPELLFAVMGAVLCFKSSFRVACFLLLWALVPFMAACTLDIITPRLISQSTLPLIIFISIPIAHAYQNIPRLRWVFIIFLIMSISFSFSRIAPVLAFRKHYELTPDYARWLGKNTEENAQLIVGDYGNFINYYANRKVLSRPIFKTKSVPLEHIDKFKSQLNTLLEKEIPVYISSSGLYSNNYKKQFSNLMQSEYILNKRGWKYVEDWHLGCLYKDITKEHIYQVIPKNAQ